MTKIFFSKNGQVKITIPKSVIEFLQLKHGDDMDFIFHEGGILIKPKKKGEKK